MKELREEHTEEVDNLASQQQTEQDPDLLNGASCRQNFFYYGILLLVLS